MKWIGKMYYIGRLFEKEENTRLPDTDKPQKTKCPECGKSIWRDMAYSVSPHADKPWWNGLKKGEIFCCGYCLAIVDKNGNLRQPSTTPDEGWAKGTAPKLLRDK